MRRASLRRLVPGFTAGAALLGIIACVTRRVPEEDRPPVIVAYPREAAAAADSSNRAVQPDVPADEAPGARADGWRDVRVALATAAQAVPLGATGAWRLYDARNSVLVRARATDEWTVERRGSRLRAVRSGGATSWSEGPLTLRPDAGDALGVFAGRRYRGSLRVVPSDSGLVVVNVLPVEEYLRGVVPLEIGGDRKPEEQAAVEAQAIAARSYTSMRLVSTQGNSSRNASFDLLSSVADQVYGGVDAERPSTDQAVKATAGLVIKYAGRVVSAPYHASCGGETASPDEVWRSGAEPFLKRVSDRVPGAPDRYYCDMAPRFAWTRVLTVEELDAGMRSYLRAYVAVPPGGPGTARSVTVDARTPSGRVARLTIATDRGIFTLRANDVRYVLRSPGGEMLNSTYFSVTAESRPGGGLARIVIRGNGYGHGIGMCQWGAIGRARAGQSARTIIATYYPGTTIGTVN